MVNFILGFIAGIFVFGIVTLMGLIFITHGYQGDLAPLEEDEEE